MIRVRALGQNIIEVKRRVFGPDAEVVFATLLYLAVERGRRVERDSMATLLWPRQTAARRRHGLRQILYKLRQLGVETGDAADSLMIPASEVWLDCDDADASDDRRTQRELATAGGVRCLPGYAPKLSRGFSEWLDGFRARAEGSARRRLVAAIVQARRAGRWEEVEPLARNCLQLDPLNEEATLALAESIALAGAKSKAVAMLDAYIAEVGPNAGDVKVPAAVLRRRIADQLGPRRLKGPLETKLIGREDVMEVLTAALEKTKAGHAATHVVWGVSGIGKTRVLEEVTQLATLMGATTVTQRAAPEDENTPGLTLVRLARAMLAAPGALGLAPDVLALLRRLTAQASDELAPNEIDVSEDALVRAIVDLERALAWERPVLIVLDDLHHADETSRRVLSRAQGCLTDERVLLLMASTHEPPSSGLGHMTVRRISGLAPDASKRLASALLDKAGAERDDAWVDALATASGGHPIVLREAVISAVQNAGPTEMSSLETILQQRFASLSSDAHDILLSTLILADHASLPLLLASTDLDASLAERSIIELEQENILKCSTDGSVAVHNVWMQSLDALFSAGRVALRRLRVAKLLESSSREGLDPAERLLASATQFQLAGDDQSAARALARSGTALQERALVPAAYAAFSRAADLDPASDQFEQCLFQSLSAAHQGDLIDETVGLIDRFGARLQSSRRLTEWEKNEVEIIALEARHAELKYVEDSQACIATLSRTGLTNIQRLRAALVGVRWAEENHDPQSVRLIVDLVSEVSRAEPRCELVARQIAMVAAISARDIATARMLAEEDLLMLSSGAFNREHIRSLLSLRVPFFFDCDFERVDRIVAIARERVQQYSSTWVALRTEDVYATHCIDTMKLEAASNSIALALDRCLQFGYLNMHQNFIELRDRLSIARGERGSAACAASDLWQGPRGAHTRAQMFFLCNAAIRAARAGDRAVLVRIEPELTQYWGLVQRGCPFDYPCVALAATYVTLGRRLDAIALVADYGLSSRVTTKAPSPFVAALCQEFDVAIR